MSDETAQKWLLYEPVKATITRIMPELAAEIGLNESIVLLQISFWISTSNNVRDGKYWTYQTLAEMQKKAFPYWSTDTIRRIVHKLRDSGYILIENHNKRAGDNTQWFALEPDKLSQLRSVVCLPDTPSQVATTPLQIASTPLQDRTTLPEITTENTQKKEKKPRKRVNSSIPNRSEWLQRLEPITDLTHKLLIVLEPGYDATMFKPAEFMTSVHLEKYIPAVEELAGMGAIPQEIKPMYRWLKPRYDENGWKIGLRTFIEQYRAFKAVSKQIEQDEKFRAELRAQNDALRAIP